MNYRNVMLVAALLFTTAVAPVVGASQGNLLAQGVAALHEKNQTQQELGVSYLESVIRNAPKAAEAGTACYQLGCYYKADREKSLGLFRRGYEIPGKDQVNAGISTAHTLVAMGRKLDAAAVFEDVGARFPDKTEYACYQAGMCYLGESRGKLRSAALRNKAKEFFSRSAAAGNPEARLQLLGMRWEDCDNGRAKWEALIPDLEAYARDTRAPAYARARAFLMLAERSLNSGDNDAAIEYTNDVLQDEYKDCRTEQAWALLVKSGALHEMGMLGEEIQILDQICAGFTDADNFGGNNVRADALYYKAQTLKKMGLGDQSSAVTDKLRQEYPSYKYLPQGGAK